MLEKSEIATQIRRFIEGKFPGQDVELTDSTNLLKDWFVDSLGIIETVLFIETNFDIDVKRADVNGTNFRDIATITGFVAERLAR